MTAYAIDTNGIIDTKAFTSLREVAKRTNLSESSLYKGRRVFIRDGDVIRIHELKIIKSKKK